MADNQRIMPYNIEAEQSVLGAIFIDPEKYGEISRIIDEDDFYVEDNKRIYKVMSQLYRENKTLDAVTTLNALASNEDADKDRIYSYTKTIISIVPSSSNALDYAKIIKDKSLLRKLITVCGEIEDDAYFATDKVDRIIDNAEQKIFNLSQTKETKDFITLAQGINQVYDHIELLNNDKEAAIGIPTGFEGIDNVIVGMGKGDLVIIGARPGMGKTSFALNIATNVAKRGKTVCIFSLEMSAEQLVSRILSSEALIDSRAFRTGHITDDEYVNLASVISDLHKANILIDETSGITVAQMKSKLRRVKNLGLVVVDYLQLMQSDIKTDNRVNEVSQITRSLKLLAKDLGVPVVCCAQLNRSNEKAADKRPSLSDLRDSGSIEQDADIVMFLYRSEYYETAGSKENSAPVGGPTIAECSISKNRHGAVDTVKLSWEGKYTRYYTLDESRGE